MEYWWTYKLVMTLSKVNFAGIWCPPWCSDPEINWCINDVITKYIHIYIYIYAFPGVREMMPSCCCPFPDPWSYLYIYTPFGISSFPKIHDLSILWFWVVSFLIYLGLHEKWWFLRKQEQYKKHLKDNNSTNKH